MFGRIRIAVVGHPNKGKTSIVATLAENDTLLIGSRSGTTTHNQALTVNTGHAEFELIDTPGFQRPQQVLKWLQRHADNAAQRRQAIDALLADAECQQRFREEVELLTPVSQGAAILYVVDGSRPYGAEYEAEMEILRWTGAASIALINPIEGEAYVAQWQQALGQYFKLVHVFNPMQSGISKSLQLLEALSVLQPNWRPLLNVIAEDVRRRNDEKTRAAAELLSRWLIEASNYQVEQLLSDRNQAEQVKQKLIAQYTEDLRMKEQAVFTELLALFQFTRVQVEDQAVSVPEDLFAVDKWYLWGVNKAQLVLASGAAGAAGGVLLDAATGLASLMTGAIVGGVAGAATALVGADRLHRLKLDKLTTGGYKAVVGPCQNLNFVYVLMARYVHLYQQLMQLTHARRNVVLNLEPQPASYWLEAMPQAEKLRLQVTLQQVSRQKVANTLQASIESLLFNINQRLPQ